MYFFIKRVDYIVIKQSYLSVYEEGGLHNYETVYVSIYEDDEFHNYETVYLSLYEEGGLYN